MSSLSSRCPRFLIVPKPCYHEPKFWAKNWTFQESRLEQWDKKWRRGPRLVRSLTLEEKLEPLFLNFTEKSFLQKFSVSFFKKRVPSIKRSGCSKSVERMPHDREVVGLNPVWRLAFILLCISSILGPSIKSSGCGTLVEHMPFDHEVVGLSPARSCTYLPNDFSLNGS